MSPEIPTGVWQTPVGYLVPVGDKEKYLVPVGDKEKNMDSNFYQIRSLFLIERFLWIATNMEVDDLFDIYGKGTNLCDVNHRHLSGVGHKWRNCVGVELALDEIERVEVKRQHPVLEFMFCCPTCKAWALNNHPVTDINGETVGGNERTTIIDTDSMSMSEIRRFVDPKAKDPEGAESCSIISLMKSYEHAIAATPECVS